MFGKQKVKRSDSRKKPINMVLVIGLVSSALLASAGVFYYYVIFVPKLEQQRLDLEKQKILQKQEEQKALKKKQWQAEHRKQVYQNCLNDVEQSYNNTWANSCQQLVEQDQNNLEHCLNDRRVMLNPFKGESYCLKLFGHTEYNANCQLPVETADQIEMLRTQQKEACLQSAQQIVYQ